MGDPSQPASQLIYSCVARGTTVLAEYTSVSGNFSTIAVQCLVKLPTANSKHTYVCDHHTFNFLVDDGFTFLAVANENFGRQVPFAFLDRVRDDFKHRYQGGRADLAVAHSLDHEFGPRLKEHTLYVLADPEKLTRIKSQVAEVKGIMMENIDKVLDRNEKIDLLVDTSSRFQSDAFHFQRQGQKIRRRLWCQHFKLKLFLLLLVVIIAFVIYLSICRGFVCHNPGIPGSPPAPATP